MLRLWPERLVAVLLQDGVHLYRPGSRAAVHSLPVAGADTGVLDGLTALLDGHPRAANTSIELIVSDSAARLIPLSWQDSLQGDQQQAAYARACFSQAGFDLDGDWLVQAAFRHFHGTGLGYALPRSLVVEAQKYLIERRIRLRSIMPMSAHAYWRGKSGIRGERTVMLLRERSRMSALLFDGKKCAGMHVQPMGTGLPDTARRLLNTVDAAFPSVSRIQYWTLGDGEAEAESIKGHLSERHFETIASLGWD